MSINIKTQLNFVAFATLTLLSTTVNSASFRFDWDYNGHITTGYFTGTENGNLITDTVVSALTYDNILVNPTGGVWYSSSMNTTGTDWTTSNGQLSFDGEENNFLFINSDYPTDLNAMEYVASITTENYSQQYGITQTFYINIPNGHYVTQNNNSPANTPDVSGWSVTRINQVPEPSVLLLIASGIVSLRCFRKRLV